MPVQKIVIKQLIALRKVLLRVVFCYLALTLILLFFSKHLYLNFLTPWLLHLPNNSSLIATSMTSPLITPLKFSCYLSLFFILPYLFIEFWLFIKPGLYQNEKRLFTLSCFSIIGLFYLGVAFAYAIIFPIFSQFIISYTPATIHLLPDIEKLLSLSMTLLLSFGLAFETPVVVLGLVGSGLVSYRKMKKTRPYVFISSFIIGMLLTPPDVISQILLAVPIYLLFEAALLVSKYLLKSHHRPDESRD